MSREQRPHPPRAHIFHRRITQPLAAQLKQGVEPARLAWSMGLGTALSILPVPGTTTALCALAAYALRLNPVAIQAANFAAAPLQLILLIPFVQLGQRLFGRPPLPLSLDQINLELQQGALAFLTKYAEALARGVLVWLLVAPFVAGAMGLGLQPLFRRLLAARRTGP